MDSRRVTRLWSRQHNHLRDLPGNPLDNQQDNLQVIRVGSQQDNHPDTLFHTPLRDPRDILVLDLPFNLPFSLHHIPLSSLLNNHPLNRRECHRNNLLHNRQNSHHHSLPDIRLANPPVNHRDDHRAGHQRSHRSDRQHSQQAFPRGFPPRNRVWSLRHSHLQYPVRSLRPSQLSNLHSSLPLDLLRSLLASHHQIQQDNLRHNPRSIRRLSRHHDLHHDPPHVPLQFPRFDLPLSRQCSPPVYRPANHPVNHPACRQGSRLVSRPNSLPVIRAINLRLNRVSHPQKYRQQSLLQFLLLLQAPQLLVPPRHPPYRRCFLPAILPSHLRSPAECRLKFPRDLHPNRHPSYQVINLFTNPPRLRPVSLLPDLPRNRLPFRPRFQLPFRLPRLWNRHLVLPHPPFTQLFIPRNLRVTRL